MQLFETEKFTETLGTVRLEQWPEGLVFWVGGEIVWKSWKNATSNDVHQFGVLKTVELETRKNAFVREHKIAAVIELKDGGPTRLIFDGGGSIDVCGGAEIWWCELQLTKIELERSRSGDHQR